MKKITIWHMNDLHSSFDRFAEAVSAIRTYMNPESDLLLDAGDFCDEKSVMISGTDGVGGIKLLAAAGFDAMAVGNNEFFAGISSLEKMAAVGLPMLSCNLLKLNGDAIRGIRTHMIIRRNNVRFLIIGTSPYWESGPESTAFTDMCGIKLLTPTPVIQKILVSEKGNYDVSILLSHAGIQKDRQTAQETEHLDFIIGGHSHTEMDTAECVNGTYIHQSGCHGKLLGKTTFWLDDQLQILRSQSENIPIHFSADRGILQELSVQTDIARQELSKVLYRLPHALEFSVSHECMAMNALADMMIDTYGGDMALINHGILSTSIPAEISQLALLEISPSPLNITLVTWSGRQIRHAIMSGLTEEYIFKTGDRWAGFRGTLLGTLAVSHNVQIDVPTMRITINQKEIADDQQYRVVTSDFLQRGSGYEMLGESLHDTRFEKEYFRDLLRMKLNRREYLNSAAIIRFHFGE